MQHTPEIAAPFKPVAAWLLLLLLLLGSMACSDSKTDTPANPSAPAASYRADVAQSWLNLQLELVRTTQAGPLNIFGRPFGYSGVAGCEAVVPGIAGATSLAGQLNGLNGLPVADKTLAYNWALSANAALATINRGIFPNASAANKATIDSLETANVAAYQNGADAASQARSIDFGKKVGAAVLEWSRTDGYDNATAYTPPTGPGLWVPTAACSLGQACALTLRLSRPERRQGFRACTAASTTGLPAKRRGPGQGSTP
ncbi:hypothetical protein [Hymenobacter ruricola]|uniref:Uncharacterized protein n=1 Tax=Hymenobacter ruricola TaxID=2791023 RepID=A0ABS0I2G9_9BACT|nr:hypothetical protein [Hymenobacter ruricola]MBF9220802.1 hypothetical protein [Hymenobacter ruricola]